MANWTQDPPERDGWYWVRWPGLSDPSRMTILVRERRHGRWTKAVDTRGEWLRIPSPDELEAMEAELASLRQEVEILRQYGNKDCTAMADEALREIREAKP